jgi:hypothetical protein
MLSNAPHPLRRAFLISATVSFLVGGLGRTAEAKDCSMDADCDAGYQCVFGQTTGTAGGGASSSGAGAAAGSASDGTAGAGGSVASSGAGVATGNSCPAGGNCGTTSSLPTKAPMPAMDAGAAPTPAGADAGLLLPGPVPAPAVTGICQPKPIVCTSAADCPSADFDCVMDLIPATNPDCPVDPKCESLPSQTSTTGTCVAKPHACSTAADCPAPLICQAENGTCTSSASAGPDGTVTQMPTTCTPGPSVCTWVPVTCTADTGCADPLYQCVEVGEDYSCSGSGGGTCAPGETCPSPSTCGSTAIMNCMPKPIDCGGGQTCPTGWSCFDFSNYNGGIRPTWSPNAPDKSCLPDGIVLATQGHAADGGEFTGNSGGGKGTSGLGPTEVGGSGGTGGGNGTGSTSPAGVNPVSSTRGSEAGSAGGEDSAAATVHSSGCAYGGREAGPLSLWLALAMPGLVVRLARRRRGAR